jgi:hypothetical protein
MDDPVSIEETCGSMYCYLWHEKTDVDECKFGERFVFIGQDPMTECRARIRNSLGVRKDKFDEETVIVDAIWDVSKWAEEVGRNRKGGHMDDYIRSQVGFRKGTTGEVHSIDAVDMAFKVNELLKKHKQPLIPAGLSQNQYSAAENVLDAIIQGKRTIVAELCARFGKTIWSGAVVRETAAPLTIVASYVLTSFASFKKDLSAFEQFRNFVLVDAVDPNWKDHVLNAINDGLQVVVFLSMCAGGNRQNKIDFLFAQPVDKLMIIDEADFGVHQSKQSTPLIEARNEDDVVILMTGTNGDKAASIWPVDHYLSVTYPELLMEKHADRLVDQN